MNDLRDTMRWAANNRFRTASAIAFLSGLSVRTVQTKLPEMERQGEVETRRGLGFGHGSRKFYRLTRP